MIRKAQNPVETPDGLTLRRFSTDDFLSLIESGVLDENDRVELIHGMIVEMTPANPPHNFVMMRLVELFAPLLDRFKLAVHPTMKVAEGEVYEPDVALLRPQPEKYRREHPEPGDAVLVIEVSHSSLPRDVQVKLPVYAAAGVPEYWVIDIERESVIVHRDPQGDIYKDVRTLKRGDDISPKSAPGFSLSGRELFE